MPSLGIEYFVAVDGLSLLMVLLSALVVPFALLASWRISDRPRVFFSLLLFLQAGLFGTFTSLNFFHWFIFWELSLVPAFFLVKMWGGPRELSRPPSFLRSSAAWRCCSRFSPFLRRRNIDLSDGGFRLPGALSSGSSQAHGTCFQQT